jgi:hypothetical protein
VLDALETSPAPAGTPAGPWAPLADLSQPAAGSTFLQAPELGAPSAETGPGVGSLPQAPEPATSGGSASAGGSGVAFSLLLALLFSFAAFALQHYSRLRLPPAQWRRLAFVAVIERPG